MNKFEAVDKFQDELMKNFLVCAIITILTN